MRLNQIVAIEKGVKSTVERAITDAHKICQKPQLFSGFDKKYQPKNEGGDTYPDESVLVQKGADKVLTGAGIQWAQLMDTVAAKDYGNCLASADVVVEGKVLVEGAPVTFLLFLEKQLNDIRKFISTLPLLDPSVRWERQGTKHYVAPVRQTHKQKKTPTPFVLVEATKEHPAQSEMIALDVVVGLWEETRYSGAMPESRREDLASRVDLLRNAVKIAREQANCLEIDPKCIGDDVIDWLFA